MKNSDVAIIGGGLAGCECAYYLLQRGYSVTLYEMRPNKNTAVHKTGGLCELVCSNSLKSTDIHTVQGLLKYELEAFGSMVLQCARDTSVPAGGALAVDRKAFSEAVEKKLTACDKLMIAREEKTDLTFIEKYLVVASGPLTEGKLAEAISSFTGEEEMRFYDAVAPIVTYESIDKSKTFFAGRYGKGGEDYLNCPMDKEEYLAFRNELAKAERVILRDFENRDVFSACMPIEIMAERGEDSMRFGPLRPVGLRDPRTGERPYAVVQLRKEDAYDALYNIVGFQTNLKFGEQKRVFGMIPALRDAEFVRYGVMHRNTFLNAPKTLHADFSAKKNDRIFFAGQISGVEGYLESAMSGLICAFNIDRLLRGKSKVLLPETTAFGSLMRYIATENNDFQPMHVSYSLMPELGERIRDKQKRKEAYSSRAVAAINDFIQITGKE